jgi:hypothetical protein
MEIPSGPRTEIPLTYNGETFVATKLGLAQHVELERWMRRVPFDMLLQTVADLPAKLQTDMLQQAWDMSQNMTYFGGEGFKFRTFSIEGIARTLWIAIKRKHPDVTLEKILEWLPPSALEDITRVIAELNGSVETNPTTPGANPPATP